MDLIYPEKPRRSVAQQVIEAKSLRTRDGKQQAITKFTYFADEILRARPEEIMRKITAREYDVYECLRDFAEYMTYTGVAGTSQRTYMTHVRQHIVAQTDVDVTRDKFNLKVKPFMARIHKDRDGELTLEQVQEILNMMPENVRDVCMMEMCTLRRPHEINNLRVRDIDFTKNPVEITVPSYISKNNTEGRTFCTAECANMLKNRIAKHKLKPDDRVFDYVCTNSVSTMFNKCLTKLLPELCGRMGNGRFKIHLYSMKKYGYSIVKHKISKEFADDLKGDISEYDRLDQDERRKLYRKVEPYLTIFNKDTKATVELESKDEEIAQLKETIDQCVKWIQELRSN